MITIKVLEIATGNLSTQHYHDKADAIKAGKWYLTLKYNGARKYRVLIQK